MHALAQIQPFDTKLFIDAAELLIEELWDLVSIHERAPKDPSRLNVDHMKWAQIHRTCVRLTAFLHGGEVHLLACRHLMQVELERYWELFNRVAEPFFEKRPSEMWPLLTHEDCERLRARCDWIRQLDGIQAATPEEERHLAAKASWVDAQKVGFQFFEDWEAVFEGDPESALRILAKEVAEQNALQTQLDQIEEDDFETDPKLTKGLPGRPPETTTADLVAFIKDHRSRKPRTPWKDLPAIWIKEHPEAQKKSVKAMQMALYNDGKKKHS